MVCRFLHPSNADESTDLAPEGILMEEIPVHPEKHLDPMVLTAEGMVTLLSEVHPLKVLPGKVDILPLKETLLSPVHPENSPVPISVTVSGMETEVIFV